jgi:hypothetical protein
MEAIDPDEKDFITLPLQTKSDQIIRQKLLRNTTLFLFVGRPESVFMRKTRFF